ncbi:uncharacterized protein METZ01_LOCUS393081 [marine metagenome]|uniref:Uncharacterized protein n=1 Tax=marine metagenome TaxID=408172 RepID=A0A382V1D9_9ZZZZ
MSNGDNVLMSGRQKYLTDQDNESNSDLLKDHFDSSSLFAFTGINHQRQHR